MLQKKAMTQRAEYSFSYQRAFILAYAFSLKEIA